MTEHGLSDSGLRQQYEGGASREPDEGRGHYELISDVAEEAICTVFGWDNFPAIAEEELAIHYEKGAKKYATRNWERGLPCDRFFRSARRHLNAWAQGKRNEPHLVAAAWNLLALIHTELMVARGELPVDLLTHPSQKRLRKQLLEKPNGPKKKENT